MTDKEFDEKIRNLCPDAGEQPAPEVWDGIESRLTSARRVLQLRRIGVSLAAAAAVAAGFILLHRIIPGGEVDSLVQPSGVELFSEACKVPENLGEVEHLPVSADMNVPLSAGGPASACDAPVEEEAHGCETAAPAIVEPDGGMSAGDGLIGTGSSASPASSASSPSPGRESGYDLSDYMAFAEEESAPDRRVALAVSSDFYTLYGSGNVNFITRSMSGGGSASGELSPVKPLSGESPHHAFPLSAGIGVQYGFGGLNSSGQHRFGVGLGVSYTYLNSSYRALVSREYLGKYGQGSEQAAVTQTVHYIGIPVSFFYNILTTDRSFFYASAGVSAEKGLQLRYRFCDMNDDVSYKSLQVPGFQWSVNAGIGFEYRFVNFFGLYADTRLTYFFDCGQPYSIREEQRLQLNLGLGARFHF